MDVLPRITRQLIEQFREMSPVQRAISISLVFVTLFGFGWLLILGNKSDFQAVSFGKKFGADELASAERALTSAGLIEFRRDGPQLLVPQKDLDRYNAALLEFDAMPADLGSQMLKQFETLGPFSTDRQRQQMKEALLLQELRRMIKAVPDVEDARVAVASTERKTGWNQKQRATANVTVKLRNGREISATLVNSLRHVVASMVPDLQPADVTIFDVTRGQAYTGDSISDPAESRRLQSAREIARQYEQQILKALSYIPQIGVTVHVDLDDPRSSIVRNDTSTDQGEPKRVANRPGAIGEDDFPNLESLPAGPHQTQFRGHVDSTVEATNRIFTATSPRAVQVSVSIPREYIREIAARRDAKSDKSLSLTNPDLIEEEVLTKVERIVGRLIPAESPSNAIAVTCVDRFGGEVRAEAPKSPDDAVTQFVSRWGTSIVVTLVALLLFWVIRLFSGSRPAPIDEPGYHEVESVTVPLPTPLAPINPEPIVTVDRIAILRDEIRELVASDPAASAELLGQWLTEAYS